MSIPLIPFHNFRVVCNRPKEEVVRILSNHIGSGEDSSVPFFGSMTSDGFKMKRQTWLRKREMCVFEGTISSEGNQVSVGISVRLDAFSLVMLILFLALGIAAFISKFLDGSTDDIGVLLFMLIIIYAISVGWFAFDVWRTKSELVRILKGHLE